MPLTLEFQYGTLVLHQDEGEMPPDLAALCVYDSRIKGWRAEARQYAEIFACAYRQKIPMQDLARAYGELQLALRERKEPRDYQLEALQAWRAAKRRGIVALPTGTGKSYLALLAMELCQRSTLVVVPTIDLMEQWASQMRKAFGRPVGLLGGGSKDVQDLTVTTYDSAVLMMEFIGNRFGFLIVDECHHLPGKTYQQLARMCLAPYRLGLSATPDRPDQPDDCLPEILGPICYRREIDELEGAALAPYRTETVPVELNDEEYAEYERNRQLYLSFLRRNRINFSSGKGWQQFIQACARCGDGREALKAHIAQRAIARNCQAKFQAIWELLQKHRLDRTLIFTADNSTAYAIGDKFFLPVLTHHTNAAERHAILTAFRQGELPVLVTSKVLNEGVDVPEANVGIVVSGSGSVREHVQRLGRILRQSQGKTAVLYEIVSLGTSEWSVSERRRQHRAYERPDSL